MDTIKKIGDLEIDQDVDFQTKIWTIQWWFCALPVSALSRK